MPGRILLPPDGDGPFPLVLLAHGAGGAKDAPYMNATAGPWATRGMAVASIDFPLHGERSEAKLFSVLQAQLRESNRDNRLANAFVKQAVSDLGGMLDAAIESAPVDPERIGFAAFSLGAMIGSTFCAGDPRIAAAALALGGSMSADSDLNPAAHIASLSPRPLLMVNVRGDTTVPDTAAQALFDAARDPKQQLWFDGSHTELPGAALKAMIDFLAGHLDRARS